MPSVSNTWLGVRIPDMDYAYDSAFDRRRLSTLLRSRRPRLSCHTVHGLWEHHEGHPEAFEHAVATYSLPDDDDDYPPDPSSDPTHVTFGDTTVWTSPQVDPLSPSLEAPSEDVAVSLNAMAHHLALTFPVSPVTLARLSYESALPTLLETFGPFYGPRTPSDLLLFPLPRGPGVRPQPVPNRASPAHLEAGHDPNVDPASCDACQRVRVRASPARRAIAARESERDTGIAVYGGDLHGPHQRTLRQNSYTWCAERRKDGAYFVDFCPAKRAGCLALMCFRLQFELPPLAPLVRTSPKALHSDQEGGLAFSDGAQLDMARFNMTLNLAVPHRHDNKNENLVNRIKELGTSALRESCLGLPHLDSVLELAVANRNRTLLQVLPARFNGEDARGRRTHFRVAWGPPLGHLGFAILPTVIKLPVGVPRSQYIVCVGIDRRTRVGVRVEFYDPHLAKLRLTVVDGRQACWMAHKAYGLSRVGLYEFRILVAPHWKRLVPEVHVPLQEESTPYACCSCRKLRRLTPVDVVAWQELSHSLTGQHFPPSQFRCAHALFDCDEPTHGLLAQDSRSGPQQAVLEIKSYDPASHRYQVLWADGSTTWEEPGQFSSVWFHSMKLAKQSASAVPSYVLTRVFSLQCEPGHLSLRLLTASPAVARLYQPWLTLTQPGPEFTCLPILAPKDFFVPAGAYDFPVQAAVFLAHIFQPADSDLSREFAPIFVFPCRGSPVRQPVFLTHRETHPGTGQEELILRISNPGSVSYRLRKGTPIAEFSAIQGRPFALSVFIRELTRTGQRHVKVTALPGIRKEEVYETYTPNFDLTPPSVLLSTTPSDGKPLPSARLKEVWDDVLDPSYLFDPKFYSQSHTQGEMGIWVTRNLMGKSPAKEYPHIDWDEVDMTEIKKLCGRGVFEARIYDFLGPNAEAQPPKAVLAPAVAARAVKGADLPAPMQQGRLRICAGGHKEFDTETGDWKVWKKDDGSNYLLTVADTDQMLIVIFFGMTRFWLDWVISLYDIANAYSHAAPTVPYFLAFPKDLGEKVARALGPDMLKAFLRAFKPRFRLLRNLYGGKIAGFVWDEFINEIFNKHGFFRHREIAGAIYEQLDKDKSLHALQALYVDDGCYAGPRASKQKFMKALKLDCEVKIDEDLSEQEVRILGAEYRILKDTPEKGFHILIQSMQPYISHMVEKYEAFVESEGIPPLNNRRVAPDSVESPWDPNVEKPGVGTECCRSLVGSGMYAARVGIPTEMKGINSLASHVHDWRVSDDISARNWFQFQGQHQHDVRVFTICDEDFKLGTLFGFTFVDADLAGCLRTGRSTTSVIHLVLGLHGTFFVLGAESSLEKTVLISTGEAEGNAVKRGVKATLKIAGMTDRWLRSRDKGWRLPWCILCDSQVALLAIAAGYSMKMRYALHTSRLSYAWLHGVVKEGLVSMAKTPTASNLSDVNTKAMGLGRHLYMRTLWGFMTKEEALGIRCACTSCVIGFNPELTDRLARCRATLPKGSKQGSLCSMCQGNTHIRSTHSEAFDKTKCVEQGSIGCLCGCLGRSEASICVTRFGACVATKMYLAKNARRLRTVDATFNQFNPVSRKLPRNDRKSRSKLVDPISLSIPAYLPYDVVAEEGATGSSSLF